MTNKEIMYGKIEKHGENLKAVFSLPDKVDPIKLCKTLRRLELQAEEVAVDYCNGDISFSEFEELELNLLVKVDKILNYVSLDIPVFFNSDPRGYALKIDDKYTSEHNLKIEKDWGGYGLIAPDYS